MLKLLRRFTSNTTQVNLIRNLAIIAHVDHGKTTLVDQLLRQSGVVLDSQRAMDSNDIEKERGITIFSKNTSITYKNHRINIVDTPGHADFGGEVERVLSMVDGVCLVVDATEGPMTQTRFVLSKALSLNLCPIVVMNKVDRASSRPDQVDNELLDLFMNLNATEKQMEYPIAYASAKEGWSTLALDAPRDSILPLLDLIIEHIPAPRVDRDLPFSMLVTQLEQNVYLGKCMLGKIQSGTVSVGDTIQTLSPNSAVKSKGRITRIFLRQGMDQISIPSAGAGDIISIAGIEATVNDTLCDTSVESAIIGVKVDEPTIAMQFYVNDSPLAGSEGKLLTSQNIRERLAKEVETNVALQVVDCGDTFTVKGRGELQMGVLIETMRREGFELSISPPRVIYKRGEGKTILEPIEHVTILVAHDIAGTVIESMTRRKGEMITYVDAAEMAKLDFRIPTRGLLGYPAEFKNTTHGQATLNHILLGYEEYKGEIEKQRTGSIISTALGQTTPYALINIEPRGKLHVGGNEKVYPGMIIGQHNRESDLEVNPVKAKHLSNVRAAGKEDTIKLVPKQEASLEKMMAYIQDDEVIEVTPISIRIRKKILDASKRAATKKKNPLDSITFE